QTLSIRSVKELRAALRTLDKEPPQALIVLDSPIMTQYRRVIMENVAHRLPVLGQQRHFAESGAVLTYSVDVVDMFRHSAAYVARILKGANPGDLPIEQPT